MVGRVFSETLGEFVSTSNHYLEVPELQRGFVWEKKHVRKLLRDIRSHISMNLDMFLGSIMIHEIPITGKPSHRELIEMGLEDCIEISADYYDGEEPPEEKDELIARIEEERPRSKLIDGQQRLSVLCIFFRLLIEKEDIFNDEQQTFIRGFYQHGDNLRVQHNTTPDLEDFNRIFANHTQYREYRTEFLEKKHSMEIAYSIFQEREEALANADDDEIEVAQNELEAAETALNAAGNELDAAERNTIIPWETRGTDVPNFIQECYEEMCSFVEDTVEEDLVAFVDFLRNRTHFAVVNIVQENQVHLVFKSINSLGKLLSTGELLKNDLFHMAVLTDQMVQIREQWHRLMSSLRPLRNKDRDVVENFIWVYCRSKGYKSPSSRGTSRLARNDVYELFDEENGILDERCRSLNDNGDLIPDANKLLAFCKELADYAKAYAIISKPARLADLEIDSEWMHEITDVRSLIPEQSVPYLLASFMKTIGREEAIVRGEAIPDPVLHRSEFYEYIRCISVLTVRLFCTTKMESFRVESLLPNWLEWIAEDTVEISQEKIKKNVCELLHQHYPSEERIGTNKWKTHMNKAFRSTLTELSLETMKGTSAKPLYTRAKYIVRGCEGVNNWSSSKRLIKKFHQTNFYTVEHILPFKHLSKFKKTEGKWYMEHQQYNTWSDVESVIGAADHAEALATAAEQAGDADAAEKRVAASAARALVKTPAEVYASRRSRLGNFLLIEKKLNSSAASRTWAGNQYRGDPIVRGFESTKKPSVNDVQDPKARPAWGKFHIYAWGPWKSATDGEQLWGSHLLCVKKFCQKYKDSDHWTRELLDQRTIQLAEQAVRRKHWRFW